MLNEIVVDDTESLLQQLVTGDDLARSSLLNKHRERLTQMVRLRMDDRLTARFDPSDVVQEALVIANQRLDSYAAEAARGRGEEPGDVSTGNSAEISDGNEHEQQELGNGRIALYPWLRKIAWEQLIKFHERHVKAAKRSVKREIMEVPQLNDESVCLLVERLAGGDNSPSQDLIRQERQEQVRRALKAISSRDREVIELRYLEHLSNAEIAAVLDISPAAVRTRHFRAIQRLHEFLES